MLIRDEAIVRMREHGQGDTRRECGGVMLGEVMEGKHQSWVLVEEVIPAAHTTAQRGSVTFTHDTWEQINREQDERYPDLRIVGTHHGYFDRTLGGEENNHVIQMINSAKPNVLIVGFGMPFQERWLLENWEHVDANIFLTGGACLDYMSGRVRRAPRWMLDNGLEWLYRLLLEPVRLWKRYLIGNPLFLYRIAKQRMGLLRF